MNIARRKFSIFIDMNAKEKLRNRLISIIQELPMDKLNELSVLLKKISSHKSSKERSLERTLSMAGAWKDLDDDLFLDLTDHLHDHRSNDRSIN